MTCTRAAELVPQPVAKPPATPARGARLWIPRIVFRALVLGRAVCSTKTTEAIIRCPLHNTHKTKLKLDKEVGGEGFSEMWELQTIDLICFD